ncbi:MAG: Mpv17/PMP22 family protein [Bacteroidota bacterium]|nr:Mpv17/PMP22 family protein [Bacteroidota bacterium]
MKKQDFIFILTLALIFAPFAISKDVYNALFDSQTGLNTQYPLIVAFVKFAVLATLGELLGVRIKTGKYLKKGFGIFPRMIIWGFLGVFIAIAFTVFASGTIGFSEKIIGYENAGAILAGALTFNKIVIAFLISLFLNTMFAPVFMTIHKITDAHILQYEGRFKSLYTPINVTEIITTMNWRVQWNFIIKKTIPIFWIPAQTINFCFPEEFRVLNAAILSVVLGVILAFANLKK